jgi:hypothetical protein
MARRSKSDESAVERKLAELDDLPADRAARAQLLGEALGHAHYRVAAKAARLAGDALLYDLVPALLAAYRRFLEKPVKSDPNCYAKKAIARALVALDCEDVEFFLAGVKLRQMEPVWGGTADTAADVRGTCALGLVATGYARALVAIAALLYDPEPDARVGAVWAVANGSPREAELLLRSKVLAGDDPAIIGECFSALMAVEPEDSLAFVAKWVARKDDALRELAALALGESRVPGALDVLKGAWDEPIVADELRLVLVRAAAAHRSEAAFDWLLSIAAQARPIVAEQVIESLELYKNNARLTERLQAVLAARGDRELEQIFKNRWESCREGGSGT